VRSKQPVFLEGATQVLDKPVAAAHVVRLKSGQVGSCGAPVHSPHSCGCCWPLLLAPATACVVLSRRRLLVRILVQEVEVVVQNLPYGSNGGEYRFNTSRTGMEQHPFHLHGHHFWLLGTGALQGGRCWRLRWRQCWHGCNLARLRCRLLVLALLLMQGRARLAGAGCFRRMRLRDHAHERPRCRPVPQVLARSTTATPPSPTSSTT
jgi:hypothetical protein